MGSLEIDAVLNQIVARLAESSYKATYPNETAFEIDACPRIVSLARQLGFDCLIPRGPLRPVNPEVAGVFVRRPTAQMCEPSAPTIVSTLC